MTGSKKSYLFFLFFLIAASAISQNNEAPAANASITRGSVTNIRVHQIHITGNKKTREYIILRELQFKAGDTILVTKLGTELEYARQQVYNTNLFFKVKIDTTQLPGNQVDVEVKVKERWYIYPIPQFQLSDRNFNEWWVKYKGDLARVTYGIKFTHYNLTGRRDQLSLYLLNGFTRNISFSYTQPYINKALTKGIGFSGGFSQSRQTNFATSYNNKLFAFNNGSFSGTGFFASIGYTIRRAIKERHIFSVGYAYVKVADSIITALNPNYFKSAKSSASYPEFAYSYQYTNVDNVAYPLKGTTFFTTAVKRGFKWKGGINMFSVEAGYNKYWDLKKKWYASVQSVVKLKLPFDQAYINQRAMGYGEAYLRGLEYYVIDGVAYGIGRSTLKKKLLSFSIPFTFRSRHLEIPFAFFAKTFADIGYSYNKKKYDTYLNNRFLYTGGLGIDIVTLYDISFRVEYSFNQLNENGLFLHARGGF